MAQLTPAPGTLPADGKGIIPASLLQDDAVETAKIKALNVTIAKLEATLTKGFAVVGPLDITGTTVWYLELPFKVDIEKVIGVVTATIDATANIQAKNAAGTMMTDGSFNLTASEYAIGKFKSCSPTANKEIAADASMQIVSDGGAGTGTIYAVVHFKRKA